MNTKHTQGPWGAVKSGEDWIVQERRRTRRKSYIARVVNQDSEANARLIAAAPEMLAALKSFTNGIEAATKRNDPVVERLQFHYHRAKTVISKAEGIE